jgi:hypothetical protein
MTPYTDTYILQPSPSTRKLLKQTPIILNQLRAIQPIKQRVQRVRQLLHRHLRQISQNASTQNVRGGDTDDLESETGKIVALENVCGVEDSAREIADVDPDVAVGLAGVAAERDDVGFGEDGVEGVGVEVEKGEFVTDRAAVPLVLCQLAACPNMSFPFPRVRIEEIVLNYLRSQESSPPRKST